MIDLGALDDKELLKLRSAIDREAKRRKLRVDIGGLGEKLVIDLYKSRSDLPVLVEAPRGTKNVDALSRDGERYSIKTLQSARKTGTIYPDSTDPNRQLFECLVIVLITDDFELERVVALNWPQFCEVRSWDSRMNAWYVARSRRALGVGHQVFPRTSATDA